MKKNLFAICTGLILVLLFVSIHIINASEDSVPLTYETVEELASGKNFFVREETVYYAPSNGTVYSGIIDGDRVAIGDSIATIYQGEADDSVLKELRMVDQKISKQKQIESMKSFEDSASATLENRISQKTYDIIDAAKTNDISDIAAIKNEINSMRQGGTGSDEDVMTMLEDERESIEERIGMEGQEIFSENAGMFSNYLDGLENVLTPEAAQEMTVSQAGDLVIKNAEKTISSTTEGEAVCKVVNNHKWYALVAVPSSKMEGHTVGDLVKLRFSGITNDLISGKIKNISEPENDVVLVFVECSTYMEAAFSFRTANVEMIFQTHEGYVVPASSIHSVDGVDYVTGTKNKETYECAVEVIYQYNKQEDRKATAYAVVHSLEGEDVISLTKMEGIKIGEK